MSEPGRRCPHVPWDASAFTQSHWRPLFTRTIGCAGVCTRSRKKWRSHLTLRFRCSAGASPRMARRKHTPPRCRPNSDTATFVTTLDIYTQISGPEVAKMVNQVTNRILGLGEEADSGLVQ